MVTIQTTRPYEFSGNFDFDIRITDWLTFNSVNNFRWTGYYYNSYSDPRCEGASGVNGRLSEYQSNTVRRYTNQILRFNKMWGKHSLNALLAYEFNDYQARLSQLPVPVLYPDLRYLMLQRFLKM